MTGTGVLLSPRWPRRRTAYERELDRLREADERPAEPLGDEDMGGMIDE